MDKRDGVGGKQSDKRVQLKLNINNIIKYISKVVFIRSLGKVRLKIDDNIEKLFQK